MKDSIDIEKIKEKINNIDHLQEQAVSSLNDMNNIINDYVNSGRGIWDGEDASEYKEDWNKKMEELPSSVENIFQEQKEILEKTISSIEKTKLE